MTYKASRQVLESCIASQSGIHVSEAERKLILKFAVLDSAVVGRADYWLFSRDERLKQDEERKLKKYRTIVALHEELGELPLSTGLSLMATPCGWQMYKALKYRLEPHS